MLLLAIVRMNHVALKGLCVRWAKSDEFFDFITFSVVKIKRSTLPAVEKRNAT